MRILAIETSCDETAIAIVDCAFENDMYRFSVCADGVYSQIEKHREFGGVFPALAKREHTINLVPILASLHEKLCNGNTPAHRELLSEDLQQKLTTIFAKNEQLGSAFIDFVETHDLSELCIDAVAVTRGPGLEPALWVGIVFAEALALVLNTPLIPVNHMEGHIYAGLAIKTEPTRFQIMIPNYPILALLISGGHTELVLSTAPHRYKKIGETLDDAVGEAFDKVARMMNLPYPGGPEVSRLAETFRASLAQDNNDDQSIKVSLPRPLLNDMTCNFSFSGLKTAVRYALEKIPDITEQVQRAFAFEFEEAVAEVLIKKTERAIAHTGAKTLVIGGGVSANTHLKRVFRNYFENSECALFIPELSLSGDNALMIAMAGYSRIHHHVQDSVTTGITAKGNLSIED